METKEILGQYYGSYDENGRLATRHGMVEFLTTMRYIEKYLQPGMRILEIGAATGRYSHTLTRMGYQVDAVELIQHNIDIFKANTQPGENVTVLQGDARDLSSFANDTYDLTLILGPMYHLFTPEDQHKALSEAIRVTKPGGVLFAAYCMGDASIVQYGFGRGQIHSIMEKCMLDPVTFQTFSQPWDLFMLYRKEDIDALRSGYDVTQLHFLAADGYASHMRTTLAEMDEETFQLFLRYHFATCERQDLVGYSNHTLDVFCKNG